MSIQEVVEGLERGDNIHTDSIQPAVRHASEAMAQFGPTIYVTSEEFDELVMRAEGAINALFNGIRANNQQILVQTNFIAPYGRQARDHYAGAVGEDSPLDAMGANLTRLNYQLESEAKDTAEKIIAEENVVLSALHGALRAIVAQSREMMDIGEALRRQSEGTVEMSRMIAARMTGRQP